MTTIEPRTTEEARAALAGACAAGKRLRAAGGGCFLWLGGAFPEPDALLRTCALDRTVFYEPEELVVKVEAGRTLAALQAELAAAGQELPWDEPWPERQTVGGIIAAGLSGPRRLACGAPRDHVLGMTAALSGGELIRPGGRVVKNVAGYDLTRLLVGSRGTLGVILEVALKVKPLPERAWGVTARFDGAEDLWRAVAAVLDARAFPSFLEARGGPGGFELATGAEGGREQVEAQRALLRAAVRGGAAA
ncbi:MAG: FAD-binding protein, partial [bacterium]